MEEEIDFTLVAREHKQEIISNPIYYAFEKGKPIDIDLPEIKENKISISKHTNDYILIDINIKDLVIIPSYKLIDRHVRIDRMFAKKGSKKIFFSQMHFTWKFQDKDNNKISFRGYYDKKGCFTCYQRIGENNDNTQKVEAPWLDLIVNGSKLEYSLFLESSAKLEGELLKADSRYNAKCDEMSETKYLQSVNDDTLEKDMSICREYFEQYSNLSINCISEQFELFKSTIYSRLKQYREAANKEAISSLNECKEHSAEESNQNALDKIKKPESTAINKSPTNEDVKTLIDTGNKLLELIRNIKDDEQYDTEIEYLTDKATLFAVFYPMRTAWIKDVNEMLCELEEKSNEHKRLTILKSIANQLGEQIALCSQIRELVLEGKGDNEKEFQIFKSIIPINDTTFEDLYDLFLQLPCFQRIENDEDIKNNFNAAFVYDPADKDNERQQLKSFIFNYHSVMELELLEIINLFTKDSEYKSCLDKFIDNLTKFLVNGDSKNPSEKNAYDIFIRLAKIGRYSITSALLMTFVKESEHSDKIFKAIDVLRKGFKKQSTEWFCLGMVKTKLLMGLNNNDESKKIAILSTYDEMLKLLKDYLKQDQGKHFNNAYLCTFLEDQICLERHKAKNSFAVQTYKSKEKLRTVLSLLSLGSRSTMTVSPVNLSNSPSSPMPPPPPLPTNRRQLTPFYSASTIVSTNSSVDSTAPTESVYSDDSSQLTTPSEAAEALLRISRRSNSCNW